jgi:large subunit ribosomal protein L32
MAALPKKKLSRARSGKRAAAQKLKIRQLVSCANCGKPVRSHVVCPYCGFYKGRQILKIEEKATVTKVTEK